MRHLLDSSQELSAAGQLLLFGPETEMAPIWESQVTHILEADLLCCPLIIYPIFLITVIRLEAFVQAT